jgi:hypothetical protein
MANRVELLIAVTEQGQVLVTGPIHDKYMCYALLGIARDIIKDTCDAQAAAAQPKIVRPTHAELGIIKS